MAMLEAAEILAGAGGVASHVRLDPRTGRLVRTAVVHGPAKAALGETVERIARRNQLPPELVHSVIQVESNYQPMAVSSKGAQGLMQLIPETARRFGVSDVFDPVENIEGGARYLKYLLQLYKGDDTLALAAYNAGEGAVARYGGVPPYPETRNYVKQVRKRLGTGGTSAAVQNKEAPAAETSGTATYNPIREVREADGKIYYVSR
jgi:soluble lytic murein transglycosylase-like protein